MFVVILLPSSWDNQLNSLKLGESLDISTYPGLSMQQLNSYHTVLILADCMKELKLLQPYLVAAYECRILESTINKSRKDELQGLVKNH